MHTVEELAEMVEYMRSLQEACRDKPSPHVIEMCIAEESRVDYAVSEILGPVAQRSPSNGRL